MLMVALDLELDHRLVRRYLRCRIRELQLVNQPQWEPNSNASILMHGAWGTCKNSCKHVHAYRAVTPLVSLRHDVMALMTGM